MTDTPEVIVRCITADEADRALGLGFAVEATPEVAAECGAPDPVDPDLPDILEEVLEAHLRPYGGSEPPGDGQGADPR